MTGTAVASRRSSQGVIALVAAALLVAGLAPAPAGALEREGFTVSAEQPHEGEYPAMFGSTNAFIFGTEVCRVATFCDVVPMEIIIPEINPDEGDEFIVEVILDWVDTGGAPADVDLYIFDNGQQHTQEEIDEGNDPPDDPTPQRVGADSATSNKPERSIMFNPSLGLYNIQPHLFSGQIDSYSLTVRVHVLEGGTPFELLAPAPTRRQPPGESSETTQPPRTTTTLGPPPSGDAAPDAIALEPADLATDRDFTSDAFGESDFDDQLAAPQLDPDIQARIDEALAAANRPPPPPSTMMLLIWLVAVPLALVGGAGAILARRRAATVSF